MSSYRLVSSCSRILSPIRRRAPSAPPSLGNAAMMSSAPPAQPPKAAAKASTKKKSESESTVMEKGDKYKAGESFFSYNPYSYYDIENKMEANRLKQPCSGDKAS